MISLTEARQLIIDHVAPRKAVSSSLAAARGSVLAESVLADAPYPAGDRSMMDGYVLPRGAGTGSFRVVGEIQAGHAPERTLGPGEAMRIFTGALLPAGGDRVVMQEQTRREGDVVTIAELPEKRFVRAHGSEAHAGDVVLSAGTPLSAAELAILAQVGAVEPRIIPSPTVRHIATGSEIIDPSQRPLPGQIRDSNSTLLATLLADLGVTHVHSQRGMDDPARLVEVGAQPADLLLISGGASVGDYDFGAETLRRLGFTIHFDKVNLRPGKPLTFATCGDRAAFVIPGNPVSHFVCFHTAVKLAIERMSGLASSWNFLPLEQRGGEPLRADPRESYWPAAVSVASGRLAVTPKRWSTSGDTFSLAGTNALIRVAGPLAENGTVETLLLGLPVAEQRGLSFPPES